MKIRSERNIIGTRSFPGRSVEFDQVSDISSNLSLNIQALQIAFHKKSQNSELSGLSEDIRNELAFIVVPNNLMVLILYFLLCICEFLLGLHLDWTVEVMPPIDCHIKELEKVSWSLDEKLNLTSPENSKYRDGCTYYDYNYTRLAKLSYAQAKEETLNIIYKPKIVTCKNFTVIEEIAGRTTFSDDYHISCSKKFWQQPRVYFSLGTVLFQVPVGFFADVYGRRPAYICTAVVLTLSSFVATLSPNLGTFVLAYCVVGVSLRGTALLLLVIFSEIFRHSRRDFMTTFSLVALQLGISTSAVAGNVIAQWRLQKLSYALGTLIFLVGIIFVPESPSFLMVNGQYKSTWDTLKELGSEEIRSTPPNIPLPKKRIRRQWDLLKQPHFRHRICMSIVLFGIALMITAVFDSLTIKFIPSTNQLYFQLTIMKGIAMAIIAVLAITFSKKSLCCSIYVLFAICFILSHFVQSHSVEDSVIVIAKTLIPPLVAIIIVYIVDIFPTTHRCTAFSLNLSVCTIIVLLYLYYREQLINHLASQTLSTFYFCVCMMCAFISLLGPRTYEELPDTKDDLESENVSEEFSIYSNIS